MCPEMSFSDAEKPSGGARFRGGGGGGKLALGAPSTSIGPVSISGASVSGRTPSSSIIPGGPSVPFGSAATGGASSGLALAASSAVGAASAPTHSTGLQNPPRFDEDVQLPLIKVVVLGATGVGKTAVVQVRNENCQSGVH